MKKQIVYASLALFGLFLIGSLTQSSGSRAHGAYSTPVQVMNTSSSPAVTLGVELAARVPYQSSKSQVCGPQFANCQFVFVPPGQGHRLVIQNVGGQIMLAPGTTALPNIRFGTSGAPGAASFIGLASGPIVPSPLGSILECVFNQPVLAYVDGGGSFAVDIYANHTGSSAVTVTGYVQDCSILPCPAIQN